MARTLSMSICECCGLPLPGAVSLTPAQRRLLEFVRACPGATIDDLADALYSGARDGGPDDGRMGAHKVKERLNHKLRPLGFAVSGPKPHSTTYSLRQISGQAEGAQIDRLTPSQAPRRLRNAKAVPVRAPAVHSGPGSLRRSAGGAR